MNVARISTIKIIVFYLISSYFVLNAHDLEDFAQDYEGYESLSSPSQNYQGRQIFLNMRMSEDIVDNVVYISNSNFIYNGYLDWTAHYFTHNKDQNCVSFGRRFNTPLGIIGTQELIYKIVEFDSNKLILEHVSEDSNTVHTINVSAVSLNINKFIFPKSVSVEPNYPNPFNPSTKIPLTVFKKEKISIAIYDSNGELISEIYSGELSPGRFEFIWNGINQKNLKVTSGVYFCKIIQNGQFISSRKMILLK
tara:strand:- start:145 stop:897 length:753 start_codon:yes stop_codon:yes gene_type:complete